MSNLVLVPIFLLMGLIGQRIPQLPSRSAATVSAYVIYIALPSLILLEIPQLPLSRFAALPIAMAWLVMAFSMGLTYIVSRVLSWSRPVTGALLLVVSLGNTAFIGIPLVETHLGTSAVPYAILYDQFGSFLALATFGIGVAAYYAGDDVVSLGSLWRHISRFPPFIALICALFLRYVDIPSWVMILLGDIAVTLAPAAMLSVGLQWRLRLDVQHMQPFIVAHLIILVLAPGFAFLVTRVLGFNGIAANVSVLQAAMPAMITAGTLATAHQLEPRLANSIVGYSLMFSLLSVWLWSLIL
ncbi:MAG: AEC family transporter [Pseudohongiellaceae bacterium]|nr:AEC family transporter [Pseudohongiellaceae bacterium]